MHGPPVQRPLRLRVRRSESQKTFDPDGQTGPPTDLADGEQDTGHERGTVVGVVPKGQRLPRGTHNLSYRVKAEIPGRFSALPAKASGMYAPELRANSDEFKVRIED